jgi:hypothetical protein
MGTLIRLTLRTHLSDSYPGDDRLVVWLDQIAGVSNDTADACDGVGHYPAVYKVHLKSGDDFRITEGCATKLLRRLTEETEHGRIEDV